MDVDEKSEIDRVEDDGNDGTAPSAVSFDLEAALARLSLEDAQGIRNEIRRRDETIQESKAENERLKGVAFADLQSVCHGTTAIVEPADYQCIVRDWAEDQFLVEGLRYVYSKTRKEALKADNEASLSPAPSEIPNYRPVRLTSKLTKAVAQKAHLCPKTGASMKCDTWLYAVAAVLGLPSETEEDRQILYRAIRGSVSVGRDDDDDDDDQNTREERRKRKRGPQTRSLTGINRSPCNLLGFAAQKEWFDVRAGVLVLPIMSLPQAKRWDGGSYSVIVVCNTLGNTIGGDVAPDEIASNIFLNRTSTEPADMSDVQSAIMLMQHIVKATAVCLVDKHGPDDENAKRLWRKYKQQLQGGQPLITSGKGMSRDEMARSVFAPEPAPKLPDGKIVAKIDLKNASIIPDDNGVHPAYPDPMLLAFKSSVNWTRAHNFQLMAEAEVSDQGLGDDLVDIEMGFSQKSESSVSYLESREYMP